MTREMTIPTPQSSGARLQRVPPARRADGRPGKHLTWVAAVAALAASGVGVVTDGAYRADPATESMLRGFDLTTLVVVVPSLVLVQGKGGRLSLVRPGLLAYLIYSYLFAAVTGGFGAAFLLDVAVACSATFALVRVLTALRPDPVDQTGRVGRRVSAALLGLLAVSLGGMWLSASVQAAVNDDTPAGSALVETDLAVRLGMTLDLWLLVPLYALAAALLWHGHRWGFPLGLLAAVSGLVHQLSYLTAMVYQVRADVPGAQAFGAVEPAIIACYLLVLAPLMWTRSASPAAAPSGGTR